MVGRGRQLNGYRHARADVGHDVAGMGQDQPAGGGVGAKAPDGRHGDEDDGEPCRADSGKDAGPRGAGWTTSPDQPEAEPTPDQSHREDEERVSGQAGALVADARGSRPTIPSAEKKSAAKPSDSAHRFKDPGRRQYRCAP